MKWWISALLLIQLYVTDAYSTVPAVAQQPVPVSVKRVHVHNTRLFNRPAHFFNDDEPLEED